VAALLTWFLPGAGHLYLGRVKTAAVLFVLIEGLFFLGLTLSEGRTFGFLDPELRGPFATILTPEVGNLGGLLNQMRLHGFGGAEASPWPDAIRLGSLLAALSGILNLMAMAHAHLEARTPPDASRQGRHPAVLVFMAWLVPGLGHLLQGRRRRAAIVFVLLVGLFVLGTWLAEGTNLSRGRHFYYWSGQFLVGLPSIAFEHLGLDRAVSSVIPQRDIGLLYGCCAGLLNVLAMLDVFGVAEKRWLARDTDSSAAVDMAGEGA